MTVAMVIAFTVAAAPATNRNAINTRTGGDSPGERQERSRDGDYTLTIRGFYQGAGTAKVYSNTIVIEAQVSTRDHRSGLLHAELLATGPYFAGQGTCIGQAVTIRGRLDAPKASRLLATLHASDKQGGRIAAILPDDVGDEGWDDEQLRD